MLGDAVAEREERPVVAALEQRGAAVGLVGHPRRAGERGPDVPVAGIERIEDVAHVVAPPARVEGGGVGAADDVEPLRRLGAEVLVDRLRRWRHVVLRRVAVLVRRDHRVPPQHRRDERPDLALRRREDVAVHVEPVVVEAAADAPRLVVLLLERRVLGAADGDRVRPDGEALVPVGVGARVDDDDRVPQRGERRRLLARRELVEQRHRRLEAGDLVAVHRHREPDDGRRAGDGGVELRLRRAARVGDPVEVRADRVEPRDVLRRRDDEQPHRAPLVGRPDLLDDDAVARRAGDRHQRALLERVLRVQVADRVAEHGVGARHAGAVGAAVVEGEVRVVANGVGGGALGGGERGCRLEREGEQEGRTAHGGGSRVRGRRERARHLAPDGRSMKRTAPSRMRQGARRAAPLRTQSASRAPRPGSAGC